MDQRDQELLDKQLRQLNPSPRSDGVMILAILAVFFCWHDPQRLPVFLQKRAGANRVERCNACNFATERTAADHATLDYSVHCSVRFLILNAWNHPRKGMFAIRLPRHHCMGERGRSEFQNPENGAPGFVGSTGRPSW